MSDENKSNEQLIKQSAELRAKIAELEASQARLLQMEEELNHREELYRSILDNSPN